MAQGWTSRVLNTVATVFKPIELRFYDVKAYSGELENRIFREVYWAQPSELPSYDFLDADLELVKGLAGGKLAP